MDSDHGRVISGNGQWILDVSTIQDNWQTSIPVVDFCDYFELK